MSNPLHGERGYVRASRQKVLLEIAWLETVEKMGLELRRPDFSLDNSQVIAM